MVMHLPASRQHSASLFSSSLERERESYINLLLCFRVVVQKILAVPLDQREFPCIFDNVYIGTLNDSNKKQLL